MVAFRVRYRLMGLPVQNTGAVNEVTSQMSSRAALTVTRHGLLRGPRQAKATFRKPKTLCREFRAKGMSLWVKGR